MTDHSSFIQGLYTAICEDVRKAYPHDSIGLERDLSRLFSCLDARGTSVFTIDLPALGRHFDKCLSNCTYVASGLPLGSLKPRSMIPKLFQGLYCRVFETSTGALKLDVDITAVFLIRQLCYAVKKIEMTCEDSRLYETTKEFFHNEYQIRSSTLNWDDDVFDSDVPVSFTDRCITSPDRMLFTEVERLRSGYPILRLLQQIADRVAGEIGQFSVSACEELQAEPTPERDKAPWLLGRKSPTSFRHGPKAVSDCQRTEKYAFSNWPEKLNFIFPFEELAYANYSHWVDDLENGRLTRDFKNHEPPCKLIAVPKTQKAPRLIASEPTSHAYCQQAVMRFIRISLSRTPLSRCLDFVDQEPSRLMALKSSLTESHWSIDLSNASDLVSCWAVERLFRRNKSLLEALHAVRTRWIYNKVDKKQPKFHKLRKFAAQGAATTFPVQSILYSVMSVACVLHTSGRKLTQRNLEWACGQVRIFGDDIIVPDYAGSAMVDLLGDLGLKVNHSKTHGTGKFRESCGMDAYAGDCVTPAYAPGPYTKARPASAASIRDCSNNFHKKGMWHTAAWLESTLPHWVRKNLPVVSQDSGRQGLQSYCGYSVDHLKKRWDTNTQQFQIRTTMEISTVSRTAIPGIAAFLQWNIEAPDPMMNWESGVASEKRTTVRFGWVPADLYLNKERRELLEG